jgi:membrane-associated protease RseP (regulator of RpoE activity)
MKNVLTLAFALVLTASAFAEGPVRRTVIVKDGKVITDGNREFTTFEHLLGKRAYLGVSMVDISPGLREHLGSTKESGVLVDSVAAGSPAEKAGVKIGDIITSIDGVSVDSSGDVRSALRDKKDGDSVRVEVQRGRNRQALVATLIEKEGVSRVFGPAELEHLTGLGKNEWRARVERLGGDCDDLQSRIKELETRLKDLEKKLNK